MEQKTDPAEETATDLQAAIQEVTEPVEVPDEGPPKDEAETTEPATTMLERRWRLVDQIKTVARINNRELTEKESEFINEVTILAVLGESV